MKQTICLCDACRTPCHGGAGRRVVVKNWRGKEIRLDISVVQIDVSAEHRRSWPDKDLDLCSGCLNEAVQAAGLVLTREFEEGGAF